MFVPLSFEAHAAKNNFKINYNVIDHFVPRSYKQYPCGYQICEYTRYMAPFHVYLWDDIGVLSR